MSIDLKHLEGRTFCIVFAKHDEHAAETTPVQIKTMHGRANVMGPGRLQIENPKGAFLIPASALPHIMPGDETPMLRGAEYFVIVKVSGMDL